MFLPISHKHRLHKGPASVQLLLHSFSILSVLDILPAAADKQKQNNCSRYWGWLVVELRVLWGMGGASALQEVGPPLVGGLTLVALVGQVVVKGWTLLLLLLQVCPTGPPRRGRGKWCQAPPLLLSPLSAASFVFHT